MSTIQFTLILIGGGTIVGLIILIGMLLWEMVSEKIRELKWQHKYKHRFDKPPTAKCYCKDCKYLRRVDTHYNRCGRGHIEKWAIAENDFCWQAEPLKRDPELTEKEK